jgi:NAD(P)-dependent dehydrogenase (short-subunit alcohol dehydrogenase family)
MTPPTQQVWFVTGSSRGFGRALVTAALLAGDRVVATARRPEQLEELAREYGEQILPLAVVFAGQRHDRETGKHRWTTPDDGKWPKSGTMTVRQKSLLRLGSGKN